MLLVQQKQNPPQAPDAQIVAVIAELVGDFKNASSRLLGHSLLALEGARHGSGGDAGDTGDIANRYVGAVHCDQTGVVI